jgi:hypothetical protein
MFGSVFIMETGHICPELANVNQLEEGHVSGPLSLHELSSMGDFGHIDSSTIQVQLKHSYAYASSDHTSSYFPPCDPVTRPSSVRRQDCSV